MTAELDRIRSLHAAAMADVLAGHKYDRDRAVCSCSDFVQVGLRCDAQTHPEHLAEVLSAAGFGPVQEARAQAWGEGFDRGFYDPLAGSSRDASESLATNPYSAAERGRQ